MLGHNIIVMGASAGGIKALGAVLTVLPASLDATVFVVQHLEASRPSILPQIFSGLGSLRATHPQDEEKYEVGRVYVAPPDFHLLVHKDCMRVVRGPQENRFRPAIDALFRSAARAHGPRVIGVVLTGYLDDGTVGLQTVKKMGGITVVQDPKEADYPGMPSSALRFVEIDHCLPIAEIGGLLVKLSAERAAPQKRFPVPKEVEFETNIAEQKFNTREFLANVEEIGRRTTYTCPECGGAIWQIGNAEPLRFRCHVGHSFTAGVLMAEQTEFLENALWSATRALEEKVTFTRHLAERMRESRKEKSAKTYETYANNLDKEVGLVRELILNGFATKRSIEGVEESVHNGSG